RVLEQDAPGPAGGVDPDIDGGEVRRPWHRVAGQEGGERDVLVARVVRGEGRQEIDRVVPSPSDAGNQREQVDADSHDDRRTPRTRRTTVSRARLFATRSSRRARRT